MASEILSEIRDFRQATESALGAMREDLAELRAQFLGADQGFAQMRSQLDSLAAGQAQILAMLTTLVGRHDQ